MNFTSSERSTFSLPTLGITPPPQREATHLLVGAASYRVGKENSLANPSFNFRYSFSYNAFFRQLLENTLQFGLKHTSKLKPA
jgi:hypothetical protein